MIILLCRHLIRCQVKGGGDAEEGANIETMEDSVNTIKHDDNVNHNNDIAEELYICRLDGWIIVRIWMKLSN